MTRLHERIGDVRQDDDLRRSIEGTLRKFWAQHRADPDIAAVPMLAACRVMRRVMPRRAFRRWRAFHRSIRKTGAVW